MQMERRKGKKGRKRRKLKTQIGGGQEAGKLVKITEVTALKEECLKRLKRVKSRRRGWEVTWSLSLPVPVDSSKILK